MEQAVQRVTTLLERRRFAHVVTFGSEMAMFARRHPAYKQAVNAADVVVPDTVGILYAARMLGRPLPERVAGVELVDRICRVCARSGTGVFLLGGAPGVAEAAAHTLRTGHPSLDVTGTQDGYFTSTEQPAVLSAIASSGAGLLLVGLGFPRQELWVREHAADLQGIVCIGVGGTLDVLSGRLARAPAFMRRLGLEWFYRLMREPHRFRRQLVLPQFALLAMTQAVSQRLKRI